MSEEPTSVDITSVYDSDGGPSPLGSPRDDSESQSTTTEGENPDDEEIIEKADDTISPLSGGSTEHEWRQKHFSAPAWCTNCGDLIWGLSTESKEGWSCTLCKCSVHSDCRPQMPPCVEAKFGRGASAKKVGAKVANKKTWSDQTDKTGYLRKQNNKTKGWSKYWFVLQGQKLYYYESPSKEQHKGVVDLIVASSIDPMAEGKFAIQMQTKQLAKQLYLKADDARERDQWIADIKPRIGKLEDDVVVDDSDLIGFRFKCCAKKIERTEVGGLIKSDPFIAIYPFTGDHYKGFRGYKNLIWRTEALVTTQNPSWENFPLFFTHTNGIDTKLVIECWDYRRNGNHHLVGQFVASIKDLINPAPRKPWVFVNPRKKTPFYKHSGKFFVTSSEPIPSSVTDPMTAYSYDISFGAENLEFVDLNIQSDPFVVVKAYPLSVTGHAKAKGEQIHKHMSVIAKTEVVKKHTSNVAWKPCKIDVRLTQGVHGDIIIEVYDYQKSGKHEFIGSIRTSLHTLLMSNPQFPIVNERKKGRVGYYGSGTLRVLEYKPNFNEPDPDPIRFCFECAAKDLDRKDLTTSDPYFVILARPFPSMSKPYHWNLSKDPSPQETLRVPIYKSPVIKHKLNPVWNSFEMNVAEFGGYDNEVKIQVWDHERSGVHNFIGEFYTTLREITLPTAHFRISHPRKTYTPIFNSSGLFEFQRVTPVPAVEYTPPMAFKVAFKAEKVERKDLMGLANSDPFFTIVAKPYMQKEAIRVYKSDVILNSRSPEWDPFEMSVPRYGGLDSVIKFEFWDQDPKGVADFIGEFRTTLRELSFYKSNPVFAIINERKKGITYKNSGLFYVIDCLPIFPPENHKTEEETFQNITINASAEYSVPTIQTLGAGALAPGVPVTTVSQPGVPLGGVVRTQSTPMANHIVTGVPQGNLVRTHSAMPQVMTNQHGQQVVMTQQGQVVQQGQPMMTQQGQQVMISPQGQMMQRAQSVQPGQVMVNQHGQQVMMTQQGQIVQGQPMMTQQGQVVQGQPMMTQQGQQVMMSPQGQMMQRAQSVQPGQVMVNQQGQQVMMTQQGQIVQGQPMMTQQGQVVQQGQPMMTQQGQVVQQGQPMMTQQGQQMMMGSQPGQQMLQRAQSVQSGQMGGHQQGQYIQQGQPMMTQQGQVVQGQPMMTQQGQQMTMGSQPGQQMMMGSQPTHQYPGMQPQQYAQQQQRPVSMGQPMMTQQGQQVMMTQQGQVVQGQPMMTQQGQVVQQGQQMMMGSQPGIQQGQYQQPMMTQQGQYQQPMMTQQGQYQQPMMNQQGQMMGQGQQPMMTQQGQYQQPMMNQQGQYQQQPQQGQMMGQQQPQYGMGYQPTTGY